MGVVVGASLTVAASPEELPVGGGSLPVAPESGKGVGMDRINQTSESGLVGFIAGVPFGSPLAGGMHEKNTETCFDKMERIRLPLGKTMSAMHGGV